MNGYESLQSAEDSKYKNLILSVAGAIFITAIGFWLIVWLALWLVSHWMIWGGNHSHNWISTLTAYLMFNLLLFAIIRVKRKQRIAPRIFPIPNKQFYSYKMPPK
jgi:hypothetical protein